MAKKKVDKQNSILLRDLSKETIKALEFYKNKTGQKTGSGAIILMISKIESYLQKIDTLQEELDNMNDKAQNYWSVLTELKEAANSLQNFDKKE